MHSIIQEEGRSVGDEGGSVAKGRSPATSSALKQQPAAAQTGPCHLLPCHPLTYSSISP